MSRRHPNEGTPTSVAGAVLAGFCAAGLALVAAGCGEDAERVSAEELIARGDAICVEGRREFERIQAQDAPNAVAVAAQVDALVEVATDELNELRTMRPPDELQERYDSYLAARGRALKLLLQGRDAAEAKDAEAYGRAQAKAAAEQQRRLELARAVGFEQCSKP
ncbi:MAG: hypothetical protein FJW90_05040 [Actinobacteria bacterium]|nr:hypothetical protein [Actinomycetota bacterium]